MEIYCRLLFKTPYEKTFKHVCTSVSLIEAILSLGLTYRVHNCVFYELALRGHEVMCDVIHEGFHEGISMATGKMMKIIRNSCMGKGDLYCEHLCQWNKVPRDKFIQ